mmetsp:Transcript_43535/g.72546  ORF Transcript_43535/g.72546 Transcript_43535/m.72546 type:complete len:156 (-) Transcript_43535:80-547(-)
MPCVRCQKAHWKLHKAACKELCGKSDMVVIDPSEINQGKGAVSGGVYNYSSGQTTDCAVSSRDSTKPGRPFKIKIQRPMAKAMTPLPDTADEWGGMLMAYNEKKNIQFYVKRSHRSHGKLDAKIKANVATAGLKAYFSATLDDRGQIELNIEYWE